MSKVSHSINGQQPICDEFISKMEINSRKFLTASRGFHLINSINMESWNIKWYNVYSTEHTFP